MKTLEQFKNLNYINKSNSRERKKHKPASPAKLSKSVTPSPQKRRPKSTSESRVMSQLIIGNNLRKSNKSKSKSKKFSTNSKSKSKSKSS